MSLRTGILLNTMKFTDTKKTTQACQALRITAKDAHYLGPYLEEIGLFEFKKITTPKVRTRLKFSAAPNNVEIIAAIRDYAQSEQ